MRSTKEFGQDAIRLSLEKTPNNAGPSTSVSKDDSFNEAKMTNPDEIIIIGSAFLKYK